MKYSMIKALIVVLIVPFSLINAASIPGSSPVNPTYRSSNVFPVLKLKDAEKLTGIRLNLIQKIKYALIKNKLNKLSNTTTLTPVQRKKAMWSLILGIGCFVVAFIPVVGLISIPAAILAIVFGVQSLKGNSNTKGIIGIVLGSLFLVLLTLIILTFIGGTIF